MAFSVSIIKKLLVGNRRLIIGTFTNGATDRGGEIDTGLYRVETFWTQVTATTSAATAPTVNESFPLAGGSVTLIAEAGQDGLWFAIGY